MKEKTTREILLGIPDSYILKDTDGAFYIAIQLPIRDNVLSGKGMPIPTFARKDEIYIGYIERREHITIWNNDNFFIKLPHIWEKFSKEQQKYLAFHLNLFSK